VKLRVNPFSAGNPMNLKDAAIVSTVVANVTWILTFVANASIGQVRADVAAFAFEAVKTYAVTWAGTFISLAGLEQYVKRTKEGET